jgi:beta-aspartyl-peptidase (threonine type)
MIHHPVVPVIVVHGGAGDVPLAKRPEHALGVKRAAEAALAVLIAGASAREAAIVAVEILEDDPLFNAGTGGCLTEHGTMELDASVMDGAAMAFGAVACLPPFRHPIRIANAVLEDGRHTLYAAGGAEAFAIERGFERATLEEMTTESAKRRLEEVLAGRATVGWAGGTVGAVACARDGTVAAATSTGGTVGKRRGRVGDTPLPGAGTWADDRAGACSATGIGELIMRYGLSKHACDLVRDGVPARDAAAAAIAGFGERVGGRGGLIVVSPRGDAGFARNTATMSYAIARAGAETEHGF